MNITFAFEKMKSSIISICLDEPDFVGPPKTNLADFIIIQIQIQIHVNEKQNLLVKICEQWKIFWQVDFKIES